MILENLPPWVQSGLPVLSLLLIGVLVERRYVGRVGTFTNAVALNAHFLSMDTVGFWLGAYADLGFLVGGYGLLAYILDEELTTGYYEFNLLFYSGLTVGLVILLPSDWFIFALLGGTLGNFLLYLWAEPQHRPINLSAVHRVLRRFLVDDNRIISFKLKTSESLASFV